MLQRVASVRVLTVLSSICSISRTSQGLQWARRRCYSSILSRPEGFIPAGTKQHVAALPKVPAIHAAVDSSEGGTPAESSQHTFCTTSQVNPQTRRPAKQLVDYSTLAAVCQELQREWVPAKVEQVIQNSKVSIALRLRTMERSGWLYISWHQTAGRLCVGEDLGRRGDAAEAYSFGERLQAELGGCVLLEIELAQVWERVIALRFGARPGQAPSHTLYCEVMARYSNVILVDSGGQVLTSAYQVGGMMSSLRLIQTGRQYQLPPVPPGVPPTSCSNQQDWQNIVTHAAALASPPRKGKPVLQAATGCNNSSAASDVNIASLSSMSGSAVSLGDGSGQVGSGILRAFHGTSPGLVAHLCERAGVAPEALVAQLKDEQWDWLYNGWQDWLDRLSSGRFTACLSADRSRYTVFGDEGNISSWQRADSVSRLLEAYYGDMAASEAHSQLHQKLTTAVVASLKKARAKVNAFEVQLSSSEQADAVQREADLITANLYRIPAGSATVEVEDWDVGEPVILTLDASKTPVQVAEGIYRRARKLRRAAAAVAPLLTTAQEEVQYLEEVEESLVRLKHYEDASDWRALKEVQGELAQGRYIKAPTDAALAVKSAAKAAKASKNAGRKGRTNGGAAPASCGFRVFVSPGGFQVLVGRNNVQNDELSHRTAQPEDIWMHVRGLPGSHTVLRTCRDGGSGGGGGAAEPTDADIQFAADLAVYYSKVSGMITSGTLHYLMQQARAAGKADVIVARAGQLKKPRGAKPGQVLVSKEMRNAVGRPAESIAAHQASDEQ